MKIKGVMFDGYGTLFWGAIEVLLQVTDIIVEDHNLDMTPEEFLNLWDRYFFPLLSGDFITLREANRLSLERTFEALGVASDTQRHVDFQFDRWNQAPVYPEVKEILRRLDGVPRCIVSNADVENIEGVLKSNRLEFPMVVTSESARSYKPSPEIFLQALDLLRCKPEEALFVGDSQQDDIVGAKKMGIPVVWVNRSNVPLELSIPKPDYEIGDLRGLLDIVHGRAERRV